ncbi:Membrane protein insertion efficiency factor YidD [hydrothermal vent metagenome]|uniref:Membrane protein insertion efficiency factor YidD n=1 Tax=hydrothermal vent metagenome TaxID=652676 RepID=A0A3B1D017_9ZZZZ
MANRFLIKIIRIYQRWVSPYLTPSCRFHPTCSEYSAEALERFFILKALGRIIVRILKCHPYHKGGKDLLK